MNNRKDVVIIHNCLYVRKGIKLTITDLWCDNYDVNVVGEWPCLAENSYQFFQEKSVDLFILELQGHGDTQGGVLHFILKWLPIHFTRAKVVIIAKTHSMGRLRDYLLGLENVAAVLDDAIKIQELQMHLHNIIMYSHNIESRKRRALPLTHQEITVLGHLLKGMPVLTIAKTLQINQKTVSSHKRAAMNKLGVTSLHSLVRCNIDLKLMRNIFNHS